MVTHHMRPSLRFKGPFKLSIVFALPHGQYTLRNLLSPSRIYDLMDYWFDNNNVLNVDFALFSTFENAVADTNKWTSCNFSAAKIDAVSYLYSVSM